MPQPHLHRSGWGVAVLGALVLFGVLASAVRANAVFALDEPVLRFFHSIAAPAWDRYFLFFSAIGYRCGVVPADIALILIVMWKRRWRTVAFVTLAAAGTGLLNSGAKHIFQRTRPSLWESIAPEHNFSFPNGHAMGSMSLALVLLLLTWHTRWRNGMLAAMIVFVASVGMSRIYLGIHYPSDILAGWSFSTAWVGVLYLRLWKMPDSDSRAISASARTTK
ncbi:MAG: phosphatase PAP2 family protein [Xanthomonadaceae bacterium]|jgi:undecaprenyl-diphosphatase|nr:phosphatase PAP2 family protein [Xanthomonadaceae bacterium]